MLTNFLQEVANKTNSDYKEIELVAVLIMMIGMSSLFKLLPIRPTTKDPFALRRLYGALGGLLVNWILLTPFEFFFVHASVLGFFFLVRRQDKNPKETFALTMIPYAGIVLVGLYIMFTTYGQFYPTHVHIVIMMVFPRVMYFKWQAKGTYYEFFTN